MESGPPVNDGSSGALSAVAAALDLLFFHHPTACRPNRLENFKRRINSLITEANTKKTTYTPKQRMQRTRAGRYQSDARGRGRKRPAR